MMFLLLAAIVLPLAGALLEPAARCRGYVATAANLGSAALLTGLLLQHVASIRVVYGELLGLPLLLVLNKLTLEIAVLSSWIIFLISLYSIGYMWHDYRRLWYWFFQNLAHTATLLLLFAGDLITLVISVNMLELCSYSLIGHWYRDEPERQVGEGFTLWKFRHLWTPSTAALRAIVITSIGASSLIVLAASELSKGHVVLSQISELNLCETALLLIAASTYSPLIPFSEWLFTAMAGPTPVSALLHSVTLVNAGAYLLLKLGHAIPAKLLELYMLCILVSCLLMGLCGLASREVKVILASSTVIYVGILLYLSALYVSTPLPELRQIAALGIVLVLAAHGFSKAALFTSCGYLMHVSGTRFIDNIPVLIRYRWGYAALVLASVNLFGVVPSTGMFLKDVLLHVASTENVAHLAISLLLAATSVTLLMKLLLYFRECRKRAEVITEIELHERTMECSALVLAVAPYVLAPLFLLQSLSSSEPALFAAGYAAALATVALCIYVFYRRLHEKIPRAVTLIMKTRLGLAVLTDVVFARGYMMFSRCLYRFSFLIDKAIHSTYIFGLWSKAISSLDKSIDLLIHFRLPRALKTAFTRATASQIERLVTENLLVTALILIILLVVLCVCCLLF